MGGQHGPESPLTNNKSQFWDEYDPKVGYIIGSFSFDNKGKCFYYTNKNGKRSKLYEGDVIYPHTWTHKGDSILNINDFERRVLHFTEDTLIILNARINDTILLVKGKRQLSLFPAHLALEIFNF